MKDYTDISKNNRINGTHDGGTKLGICGQCGCVAVPGVTLAQPPTYQRSICVDCAADNDADAIEFIKHVNAGILTPSAASQLMHLQRCAQFS